MGIFDNQTGDFVFAPKTGAEDVQYTITGGLKRIKNDDETNENNYKKQGKNFGYYDVLEVDGDKQLLINTWKLYFALKELNPDEGDLIIISHPDKGEYNIKKA